MEKIIARYFYSPICPEAFATKERLTKLFDGKEKKIVFETHNMDKKSLSSACSWYPIEAEIISRKKPMLYGRLFINGEAIAGFPPSKKQLQMLFSNLGLEWNEDYSFHYGVQPSTDEKYSLSTFTIRGYDPISIRDVSLLCTKYNAYLNEKDYLKSQWKSHEEMKSNYLLQQLEKGNLLGQIAYYGDEEPVGFIEAFDLQTASQLGFPVSRVDKKGIMITCLIVRRKMMGNGVAKRLLQALEAEARELSIEYIEVLGYPDEGQWQPLGFYKKNGYTVIGKIESMSQLGKTIK